MRSLTSRVVEGRRERRGTRRKREARARLLHTALLLLSEKNVERVVINEITEAANMGFDSLYNRFELKEGLFAAVVDRIFENFTDKLDTIAHGLTDPAEVIAITVRHTLLRTQRKPA